MIYALKNAKKAKTEQNRTELCVLICSHAFQLQWMAHLYGPEPEVHAPLTEPSGL
jgi:hypothetical protein